MTKQNELEPVNKGMTVELDNLKERNDVLPSDLDAVINNSTHIKKWWQDSEDEPLQKQVKLINHVWENNPQFKDEDKKHKYVVRTKKTDKEGKIRYMSLDEQSGLTCALFHATDVNDLNVAKFGTPEEAEEWINPETKIAFVNVDEKNLEDYMFNVFLKEE